MDSQLNLGSLSKGRTGSNLQHVQRRTCANLLPTGMRELLGYVRTDRNLADRPSRDKARWGRPSNED